MSVSLVLGACVGGPSGNGASPSANPTPSPTPSPSGGPLAHPLRDQPHGVTLAPGTTWFLDYFPVDLTFDVPDEEGPGWHVGKSTPDVAIVIWNTPPDILWAFAFWNVDNVYADPCAANPVELDPPLGPSVDDLVTAITTQPAFTGTGPLVVTVGAFQGKDLLVTNLNSAGTCPEAFLFSAGEDGWALSSGESIHMQIFDADGVRLVMTRIESTEPDSEAQSQLQQILDSIRIGPGS